MEQKTEFEKLLNEYKIAVERYVNYRVINRFDADDVIQETYCAAHIGFDKLRNKELFKPWILSIAKNQCNLWLRKKYRDNFVSLEEIPERTFSYAERDDTVSFVLSLLPKESSDVLKLTMRGLKQNEIAKSLSIPLGTVKSRLYYAKKQFRSMCTPEQITIFEKGRKNMAKTELLSGFPVEEPGIVIKESNRPFFPVKCADESFIIPVIGNCSSEGTYRYPNKKLSLVSTCYVPKAAQIHGVNGVKVCRDTYNVKADILYKNESVWFTQLTDEYVRDLGTIVCDEEEDYPTEIHTFLEEDYDVIVNGNDRIHGRPLLIKENPAQVEDGKVFIDEYNTRYTMGTYDISIGDRTFETIKYITVQQNTKVEEYYVDSDGRLVFMRWYESVASIEQTEWYPEEFKKGLKDSPKMIVNGIEYRLVEDRISQYAL